MQWLQFKIRRHFQVFNPELEKKKATTNSVYLVKNWLSSASTAIDPGLIYPILTILTI